jgi:lysophospholipase L1-like esterase
VLIEKGQKLVMIGDSITDCDRARPIAEGLFDPLGRGYVNFVSALIGSTYPERHIRVVNVGCSGNTVRDLTTRWKTDVLDLKPAWVSCMIGTNDVWRQFDLPLMTELHVYPEEYESAYAEILEQTRSRLKGLVLMTPFYVEPNRQDTMRKQMDRYGEIARKLARRFDAVCIDTQAAFDRALEHCHSASLAWDRVHPNQVGHMLIAKAFLTGVGFQW